MSGPRLYCVITIDTEADHSPGWIKPDPLRFNSIMESIPGFLEPLFRTYGATPTYLLTVEVLEDERAVSAAKKFEQCELGTHLHPEYIAPERKFSSAGGTLSREFSNDYPPIVEQQKLDNLSRLFEDKIGYRATSFRGGKFGFSGNTARALLNLGYLVDTSVTPNVSWAKIGGPDFQNYPQQPYFINNQDNVRLLLEVPVSIAYLNNFNSLFRRPTWLRPTYSSFNEMKYLITRMLNLYRKERIVTFNIMFHSMEFYPGASPYAKDWRSVKMLLEKLGSTLSYFVKIGVEFRKLSELNKVYEP